MSVISKETARRVANHLTQKKREEIKNLKAAFGKAIVTAYNKTIPAQVKRLRKLHPDFIKTTKSLRLEGNGWNYQYFVLPETVIDTRSGESKFYPEGEDSKKLVKMFNDIELKEQMLEKLMLEIEGTLLSLKTYKRIEEQFNEAYLLMPERVTSAISVNVLDLRKKLAS